MIRHAPATLSDHPVPARGAIPRLDGCVLLAGGLVPSPLARETRRLTLELWLTSTETVFSRWCDVLDELSVESGVPRPMIRVVHSGPPYEPTHALSDARFEIRTMAEPDDFRGPAGVLRDVTRKDDPESTILVAEAARYIAGSLTPLFRDWAESEADILIARSPEGKPAGIMLIRTKALEIVPEAGYMDIKEQWLPRCIERGFRVRTSTTRQFMPFPLRSREQFLSASAVAVGQSCPILDSPPVLGPLRPLGRTLDRTRISEDAQIAHDAIVADSVVMPGAKVGAGAVVVRSLVCPNARVSPGQVVVDTVVASG